MFFESIKKLQSLKTPNRLLIVLGVLMCLGLGYLYWVLGTMDLIGFTRDDGIYVITSEALAKIGKPNLIHFPVDVPQVKYPLGYPLMLMPVWWLMPHFPHNQLLLSAITSGSGALGLIAVFAYLIRVKKAPVWASLIITLLMATNFYWIYFASGLMAEAPYLLVSFLALMFLEPSFSKYCQEESAAKLKTLLCCAVVSALPFHFRQIGLCIPLACGLFLLLNKRYRDSLIFLAVSLGLSVVPWSLWTQTFQPTAHTYETTLGYTPYLKEFLNNFSSGNYGRLLQESFGSLVYRILEAMFALIPNLFKVITYQDPALENNKLVIRSFLLLLTVSTYALAGYYLLMLVKRVNRISRSRYWRSVSIGCWYLVAYLALCVFWGYEEQMSRFLPMVLPLLWWYALQPFLLRFEQKRHVIRYGLLLALILGLAFYPAFKTFSNIFYVRMHAWIDMDGHPLWEDYVNTQIYIDRFLPKDAIIATTRETVAYLYTGRKVYHLNDYAMKLRMQKVGQDAAFQERLSHMEALGVNYILVEPAMRDRTLTLKTAPVTREFINQFPDKFRLLSVSPNGYVKIYRFFGNNHQKAVGK